MSSQVRSAFFDEEIAHAGGEGGRKLHGDCF